MQQDKDCDWTGLKFSMDGKLILVSTNGQVVRLIDAFQGTPIQTFMVKILKMILCLLCASDFDSGMLNELIVVIITYVAKKVFIYLPFYV